MPDVDPWAQYLSSAYAAGSRAPFGAALGAALLSIVACAPRNSPSSVNAKSGDSALHDAKQAAPPKQATDSGASLNFADSTWTALNSKQHGLRLELPEARQWSLQRGGSWLQVRHTPTQSSLSVKHWNQARLADAALCEEQALLGHDELKRAANPLAERALTQPAGFVGKLYLYADAGSDGIVRGRALAYSAQIRECFAFQYETTARGPQAAETVAARLAQITEHLLPSIAIQRIEARALQGRP